MPSPDIDRLCVNTIRTLSMDAVQQANSGHPGTPMAMAPVAYALWQRHLRFDPDDPIWPNRDRFVLSMGHASMLLYSMLHLTGVKAVNPKYEALGQLSVTLDDIKRFRQLDSRCAGHPEYRWTSGVETTTGPLGQGVATSVGMAIASKWLAAHFNRPGFDDVRLRRLRARGRRLHDGRHLERGRVARRASQARQPLLDLRQQPHHHRGQHELAFSEDVATRFIAYGWNVTRVGDANDLDDARPRVRELQEDQGPADADHRRQPHRLRRAEQAGHASAHGEPLGEEEIKLAKRFYGWPEDAKFLVPDGVREHFAAGHRRARREAVERLDGAVVDAYQAKYPEEADRAVEDAAPRAPRRLGEDRSRCSRPTPRALAGRDASQKVLNAVAQAIPWLIGGSADLAPSTKTRLTFEGAGDFSADELRRPQLPLRHPRARDGRDPERPGALEDPPLRLGLPDLQRLRPSADPAGRDHGDPGRSTSSRTTRSASARTARRTSRSSRFCRCARSRAS